MNELKSQIETTAGDLVSFDVWLESLNRTRATGHRWRQKFPWLETINIFGKLYIRRTTIEEFERRAAVGEFQRDIRPNPNAVAAPLPEPCRRRKKSREPR
jgi:hypothetical protein